MKILILLAACAAVASADCLYNCNTTYIGCQYNQYTDKSVCSQGMESCVLRCFNQSNSNETFAQTCLDRVNYCDFFDEWTCRNMLNSCMDRAFKPKPNQWWWSNQACTDNCRNASVLLCNHTLFSASQCRQDTNACYNDCFSHDYSPHALLKWSFDCDDCMDVARKFPEIAATSGCADLFVERITQTCRETLHIWPPESEKDAKDIRDCVSYFDGRDCSLLKAQVKDGSYKAGEACKSKCYHPWPPTE